MSERKNRSNGDELRRRAEQRLREHLAGVSARVSSDPGRLLHELEVHEVELEMQNDELRTSRWELERALARYTELFDFAPIGYVVVDALGTIRAGNHAAVRMLGSQRGRIVGGRLAVFVAGSNRAELDGTLARALAQPADERRPLSCELTLVRERESCEVRMTMIAIDDPQRSVLVAMEDVTERNRVAELRAQQTAREQVLVATRRDLDATQRLHEISTLFLPEHTAPDVVFAKVVEAAIAISDADFGDLQMFDRRTDRFTIRAQRGLGQRWADFWDAVDGIGARGAALKRGERVIIEDIEQSALDEERVLEIKRRAGIRAVVATPLMSRSGRPLGTIAVYFRTPHRPDDRVTRYLDLLSRQAADLIVRMEADAAEALLRRRFEASDQVSIVLNQSVIERRGEALSDEVLSELAEVARSVSAAGHGAIALGDDCRALERWIVRGVSPDGAPASLDHFRAAARELGRVAASERSAYHRETDVTVLASAIRDHGRLAGCLCVARPRGQGEFDADERMTLEMLAERIGLGITAARLTREMLDAVRARENLLAIVSHDLRSPLSSIRLSAGLIASGQADERQASILVRSAERMNRLIEDLLQAASIEAGMFTVEPVPMEVLPLLQDAVDALAPSAAEMSIQLDLDVSAGLPAIRGDRERLLQVLSNLIGNALKFVGKNGRVHVHACRAGDRAQVSVSDNGPGIPEHDLPRLFDRYERGTSKGHLGVGLGLYIAKGIDEAHGGRIWVESQLGAGATFFFTVPLA